MPKATIDPCCRKAPAQAKHMEAGQNCTITDDNHAVMSMNTTA